jgi:hypothetical protein
MGVHYFSIKKDGIAGMLTAKGSVASLDGLIKDLTKKGLNLEEITQEDADKLKQRLEV